MKNVRQVSPTAVCPAVRPWEKWRLCAPYSRPLPFPDPRMLCLGNTEPLVAVTGIVVAVTGTVVVATGTVVVASGTVVAVTGTVVAGIGNFVAGIGTVVAVVVEFVAA